MESNDRLVINWHGNVHMLLEEMKFHEYFIKWEKWDCHPLFAVFPVIKMDLLPTFFITQFHF